MMSREAGAVGDQTTQTFQNNKSRMSRYVHLYERTPFVRHQSIVAIEGRAKTRPPHMVDGLCALCLR
jgi:hypothetical protein